MLWRVIAFNIGIEIGQLATIVGTIAIATVASMVVGESREPCFASSPPPPVRGRCAVAAALVAFATVTDSDDTTPVAVDGAAGGDPDNCTVAERTEAFPGMGGHAAKNFYEPDEETPMGDFGHSLADGYLTVLYPETLEQTQVDELRTSVTGPDGEGILAGPSSEAGEEVRAVTTYDPMTCGTFDVETLQELSADWFESIQG